MKSTKKSPSSKLPTIGKKTAFDGKKTASDGKSPRDSLASAKMPFSESSSLASLQAFQAGASTTTQPGIPSSQEKTGHDKTPASSDKEKRQKKKKHKVEAGMQLFEEDVASNVTMAQYLRGFVVPGPREKEAGEKESAKLGVMLGVYLPTIQNILGVTMFLRLPWIVGVGGVGQAFIMVFICCLCTFLTSISISAVATNGVIESGGTYFVISRNLGPEIGAAIGILFYLANTVATSMYCIGGVEILLVYMFPDHMPQFGDPRSHNLSDMYNNFRLYGSGLLVIVIIFVAAGVNVVQFTAPFSLLCVILSVFSVYIGALSANEQTSPALCTIGREIVFLPKIYDNNIKNGCTLESIKDYYYSHNYTKEWIRVQEYMETHDLDITVVAGIPGPSNTSLFASNWKTEYLKYLEAAPGQEGDAHHEVVQDVDSSFWVILAIFFPSVTGIFTGCNMSGDLKDPQKSLPIGTISAQLTTSFVYLTYVFLFGGTMKRVLLRDKYGDSLNKAMIVAQVAWPTEWVLLIGALTSTFGAALQSLCSAPRLLQSIAKDDVISFLRVFGTVNRWNEPWNALWISSIIAEVGVLIGSIEEIAPVVDFFFLMCYLCVNVICVLQTLLQSPNWRPRFKYYHWTLSFVGAFLCLFIMFSTYWYYTLLVFILAGGIYKFVEYRGAKKEWGDGLRGLAITTAQLSLLRVEDKKYLHPKNWRPQILVLVKMTSGKESNMSNKMVQLAGQLKGGQGLTLVCTLLDGDITDPVVRENGDTIDTKLKDLLKEEKVKGFTKVIIGRHSGESISCIIQSIGIGGLKPNTVMVGWPSSWKMEKAESGYIGFIDAIHRAATADMCLLVPKNILKFPAPSERLTGNIDVWWIVQSGGLVILIPFLLKMDEVWRHCKLRVFAVANERDNITKMREGLEKWVYQLRIDASVEVIPLADTTIAAYTFDRSLRVNERNKLAQEIRLTKQEIKSEPQMIVDKLRATPTGGGSMTGRDSASKSGSVKKGSEFDTPQEDSRTRKMVSAVKLNQVIRLYSATSELAVVNLPRPPSSKRSLLNFFGYMEALTEGLKRVIMVRGSGTEVITIY